MAAKPPYSRESDPWRVLRQSSVLRRNRHPDYASAAPSMLGIGILQASCEPRTQVADVLHIDLPERMPYTRRITGIYLNAQTFYKFSCLLPA